MENYLQKDCHDLNRQILCKMHYNIYRDFFHYYNSEIIYINPIFMLFGYRFYHLYTEKNYVILLSKQDIYRNIGENIKVNQLSSRLYIVYGE